MKRLLIIVLIMNVLFSCTSKGNKNNQENNKIKSESVSLLTESTDIQENNAFAALHTEESVIEDSIREDLINNVKSIRLEGGDTVRFEKKTKKSNEYVLFDMILASNDSMYHHFRASYVPVKKINDSVYAITVLHNSTTYRKYHLGFELWEGYVELSQYNNSDGSYVYLISMLEGESYFSYAYLYKNGNFSEIPHFWGCDHPLEYIWSDSLVNSHIDGQNFYSMSFDANGPNTIRIELMDDRMPKENPGCFLGDYVDYAFDSVKGQMVKQKIGWKDDLKTE